MLNFDNIENIVCNPFTGFQKIKRFKDGICTLSQNSITKPSLIGQFISEDKIKDRCEMLTSDPELIQKYNKIIEDNSPLFSAHAYDIRPIQKSGYGKGV